MAENSGSDHQSERIVSTDAEQMASDAEGVWSPDIEQSFQEALAIYPPCGRRKIILSDEGKMYGRNELIARYIKLRTGKTRSRKQVSSHIQVLARRKVPYQKNMYMGDDNHSKDKALQAMASMSSAQIVSANALHAKLGLQGVDPVAVKREINLSPQGYWPPAGMQQNNVPPPPIPIGYPFTTAGAYYASAITHATAISQAASIMRPSSALTSTNPTSPTGPHLALLTKPGEEKWYDSNNIEPPTLPHSGSLPLANHHSPTWQSRQQQQLQQPSQTAQQSQTSQPQQPQQTPSQPPPPTATPAPTAVSHTSTPPQAATPALQSTQLPLRLIDFSAYIEQQRLDQPDAFHKHLFVHLGPERTLEDPAIEAIDIRQIYDKFPEKKGGLKELYEKGPPHLFFLVKFWADLNTNISDDAGAFYGVSSTFESSENMTVTCSTKVCSFGKQVVEKVETEYPRYENGRFVYRIHRSPMCEYMINFIHKLKHLPEKFMMNSVLENFTILQVVSNRETQETLLCLAFVFEVSSSEHGAQHHTYKLVRD